MSNDSGEHTAGTLTSPKSWPVETHGLQARVQARLQTRSQGRFMKALAQGAWLLVFTLILTWLLRLGLDQVFELKLNHAFWLRDFIGNLVVTLLSFALVQQVGKSLMLASVIIIGFQLANAGKLVVLGTPISPDDFMQVQNLFYLTDGWRRIVLMILAASPVIAAVILIPFRRWSVWAILGLMAGVALTLNHYSQPVRIALDKQFGNSVWNQPENFRQRGLALHITQETVRTLAKIGKFPDELTVQTAVDQALELAEATPASVIASAQVNRTDHAPGHSAASPASARNVHIMVLESFFDPMTLGREWVPEDPFPASFRTLWEQTGHSKALSPVFGGYTANAEFETLCGYPVTENAVFFEGWLRRAVPCLPSILADAGYRTVASHPNVPGFWNRTHAYHLMGFNHYLSKTHFDLSDSVDGLLLDHSYYRQVYQQLPELTHEQPVLNYMLTYHGHLPYPSNEHYPDKIKAGRDAPLLHGYLNQIWYKSRDLMSRLDILRKEDPDALIVVFGDHLPFLGPNYGVYSDVLNLPEDRADFTGDMLEYLVSTPLVIIDGERGPLKTGKLPLYKLPTLILELLGKEQDKGMLKWTTNPENTLIRPVYGMHINITANGAIACPDDRSAHAECAESASWLERTRVLIRDLFTGKQHGLKQLPQDT